MSDDEHTGIGATIATLKEQISLQDIVYSLAIVTFLYICIFFYILVSKDKTIEYLEQKLASKTALILMQSNSQSTAPIKTSNVDNKKTIDKNTSSQIENSEPEAQKAITNTQDAKSNDTSDEAISPLALIDIPYEGLYQKTGYGLLPKIRDMDNLTPYKAYQKPIPTPDKPTIALIITDFGLSDSASEKILSLPSNATLLVSSYSPTSQDWIKKARAKGFETWLFLPFENKGYPKDDPGPDALITTASLKYNENKLKTNMGRLSGYPGVASKTDEVFGSSPMILKPLIKNVYARGLGFLELNPDASDEIKTIMKDKAAPYIKADILINNDTMMHKKSPLKELERIAKSQGHAIGVMHPYPKALGQIEIWLNSLSKKGFALTPVSTISNAYFSDIARELDNKEKPKKENKPSQKQKSQPGYFSQEIKPYKEESSSKDMQKGHY